MAAVVFNLNILSALFLLPAITGQQQTLDPQIVPTLPPTIDIPTPVMGVIDGVWHDDFRLSSNGTKGWHIFNGNGVELEESLLVGESELRFHGPLQRLGSTNSDQHIFMARRIQCAYDASVYISVTAAGCWSITTNHFRYYPLYYDWSLVGISDGYADSIEGWDLSGSIPESGDFRTDGDCYSFSQFATYNVDKYHAGDVSVGDEWTVQFKLKMSSEDDATLIYNISIECRAFPTVSPTADPTLKPTIYPSMEPTSQSTHEPSQPIWTEWEMEVTLARQVHEISTFFRGEPIVSSKGVIGILCIMIGVFMCCAVMSCTRNSSGR